MCVWELNGWVDRIDVCEKVLKLILTVIPYHENVIYVASSQMDDLIGYWFNMLRSNIDKDRFA